MTYSIIKKNAYYDSVTLMRITAQITNISGVRDASVCMGTELNRELLVDSGLSTPETSVAGVNDLIIAFDVEDSLKDRLISDIEGMLSKKSSSEGTTEVESRSIQTALTALPDANLAIISVPGRFAYLEAKQALMRGLNVMIFSDNVTIAEEKELKDYASAKGLLVMGPDCGTAIINGKGLCFANEVRRGNIGIVAASGTGLQEVTVLIDHAGGGISQAIGVGGRDLDDRIGGVMMLDALTALAEDAATETIVLVSKQPSEAIADRLLEAAKAVDKPVIICFLGTTGTDYQNVQWTSTLEEAAIKALASVGITSVAPVVDEAAVKAADVKLQPEQKYVRGLYCGGTLCSEAAYIFKTALPEKSVFSNSSKKTEEKLADPFKSQANSFIDLGDDLFTSGKPHPMIDPSIRNGRILQEAKDPETAVILLDFVIGYGANEDPVGVALPVLAEAKKLSPDLCFVAYVCGTDGDFQDMANQTDRLRKFGAIIAKSNAEAARTVADIIKGRI